MCSGRVRKGAFWQAAGSGEAERQVSAPVPSISYALLIAVH